MSAFRGPRALSSSDNYGEFDCGAPSLNSWLMTRALKNERAGASRTFVSVQKDTNEVAGYYCLSASALSHEDAPGSLKRNMPDPVSVILIGRLAVDKKYTGQGLGASLLQHAMIKGIEASRVVGARAFIVDALDAAAESFYAKFGFTLMPPASNHAMYLLVKDAEATVEGLTL